jgi:hypothetical protein
VSSDEFKAAQTFVLKFGTHRDKPIDVYLTDSTIQKELGLIHAKRRSR